MTNVKTIALAGLVAASASFISTAHADTVGCDCSYNSHDSYKSAHWEQVVTDLKIWTSTHEKHHPYYYTMQKKLVSAEYNWEQSKKSGDHTRKHSRNRRECKHDVSPS